MKNSIRIVQLALFIMLSSTLFAAEGVVEINQVCATQLGCFSGDTSGFPVTIADVAAGTSFILTSDLVLADTNTDGIALVLPGISIDLNGFSIIGQACVGSGNNCTPTSGTGIGINAPIAALHGTSVKNGNVIGMGGSGLVLIGVNSSIKNVTARWNRVNGLVVGESGSINDSRAANNGMDGILFFQMSSIKNSFAINNGSNGLQGTSYAIIENNIIRGNGLVGILTSPGFSSIINGNTVDNNGGHGVQCGRGSRGCLVTNNFISTNTGSGLFLTSSSAYRGNVLNGNGTAVNGGVNMGGNLCGTVVCP